MRGAWISELSPTLPYMFIYLRGGSEVADLQVIRDDAAVGGDVGVADGEVTPMVC